VKTKMPLAEAERIGRSMVNALLPLCERVELAGSIRRRAPFVGDVEIVCVPKMESDMFGGLSEKSRLEFVDWELYGTVLANGPRLKKVMLREGIQLDLSIVLPPAQWGVLFLIRTGPKNYSNRMVTRRRYYTKDNEPGLMPSNLQVKDGAVWENNQIVPTPEESDVYTLFGLGYVPPEMRK
jgi:DNA polymerase/3'-5' exonuclease PolX